MRNITVKKDSEGYWLCFDSKKSHAMIFVDWIIDKIGRSSLAILAIKAACKEEWDKGRKGRLAIKKIMKERKSTGGRNNGY